MNDWHPISTAPRDGTVIDLWFAGEWNRRMTDAYWSDNLGAWVIEARGCSYLDSPTITHWKPLPMSPDKEEKIAFLNRIIDDAQREMHVTSEDVARLRKLADWADTLLPSEWYGTIDKNEAKRAVEAAKKRMGIE